MLRTLFAGAMCMAALAGPAQTAQLCTWMDETVGEEDYRELSCGSKPTATSTATTGSGAKACRARA